MSNKKLSVVATIMILILSLVTVFVGCSDPSSMTTAKTSISSTPPAVVTLDVSAAASMTDALQAVNDLYIQKNANVKITANFASSGTLQKQIEQGAPADVFISAAAKQMNALQDEGLIVDDTRQDLLNNKVVLVVPTDSNVEISDFTDLINDDVKQVAIGDPEFVPAGTYGKQALELLGIYEQVQAKLILGSDVRNVLSYVESGNVDAGIVYATDAAITDNVKIAAAAPDEINSKIVYPVAVIKGSDNVDVAVSYINFLFGDEAAVIFEEYGFSVVD